MRFLRQIGENAARRRRGAPQSSAGAPVSTWIGGETRMEGRIASDSDICIQGDFEGEIEASAEILISEGARVRARVSAQSVVVVGSLEGPIAASEVAELGAGAHVVGDIHCDRVALRPGAEFDGSIVGGDSLPERTGPEAPESVE